MAMASLSLYASPKRKREVSDPPDFYQSHHVRIRTDLPMEPLDKSPTAIGSPRTSVAGQLQALHLQQDISVPPIDFGGHHMDIEITRASKYPRIDHEDDENTIKVFTGNSRSVQNAAAMELSPDSLMPSENIQSLQESSQATPGISLIIPTFSSTDPPETP